MLLWNELGTFNWIFALSILRYLIPFSLSLSLFFYSFPKLVCKRIGYIIVLFFFLSWYLKNQKVHKGCKIYVLMVWQFSSGHIWLPNFKFSVINVRTSMWSFFIFILEKCQFFLENCQINFFSLFSLVVDGTYFSVRVWNTGFFYFIVHFLELQVFHNF